jgi:hypothetical protein
VNETRNHYIHKLGRRPIQIYYFVRIGDLSPTLVQSVPPSVASVQASTQGIVRDDLDVNLVEQVSRMSRATLHDVEPISEVT